MSNDLVDDDADWAAAEEDEMPPLETAPTPPPSVSAAAGIPVGAQPPQAGGPAPPGMQPIDPKLVKKWNVIYPCFINPRKKVSEGRRLPLHLLVGCDDPWPQEIGECLVKLGFKFIALEPKAHPQDWLVRARVRVQLHDDAGTPLVEGLGSKQAVLKAVAKLLPYSPFRNNRLAQQARQMEAFRQQQAAAAAAAAASPKASPKKEEAKALTAGGASGAEKKAKKRK